MRILLLTCLLILGSFPLLAGVLAGIRVVTPSARQYEEVEIALTPEPVPGNPFDPNQVTLDAVVTAPSGRQFKVPGFWFQDYRRSIQNPEAAGIDRIELLTPAGRPEWRLRFSSAEPGEHRVLLELRDAAGTSRSQPVRVRIEPRDHGGFLRVSPRNPLFFENERGRPFFPLGQNLCMYQRNEGTYYFDRLLARLAAAGGNYVRLWQEYYVPPDLSGMSRPGLGGFTGFPLETEETGLGRYDLASAWRLDHVAGLCESLGIRWQLAFEMVTWWERRIAHKWKRNRYNAANGGPCANPSDYLTNPAAKELVRRRLRYSVARWGYTPYLLAWELWNEVDNMDDFSPGANAAWHREMASYLKQIDPWRHLVTSSWRDPKMFSLPEIDIVQAHSYWEPQYDTAEYSWQDTEYLMRPFGKPFLFGEQGIEGPVSVDPDGRHFHDALWATTVSGAAGAGMYWWWHNYIEPYDLYRHYTPLAAFIGDIDWPSRRWKPVGLSRPSLPAALKVYGIAADDTALVWIHDPLAFRIVDGKALRGPAQTQASVNVVGLADGDYRIEWWDTNAGKVVRADQGDVKHLRHFGYGLELKPPEFWSDIAAKIRRLTR